MVFEDGASVGRATDGSDVGTNVAAGRGGVVRAGVVGEDVATVAATVGARVEGKTDEGAGVAKEVGGKVVAGMMNLLSAKSLHVGPIRGIAPFMVALAMYSDSMHLFANSETMP